jgi:hypothetical protein
MTERRCRHHYIDHVASPIVALKREDCFHLFERLMQDLDENMVIRIGLELAWKWSEMDGYLLIRGQ